MKQCIDILPLFVFFVAYKTCNIFIASSALIMSSAIVLCLKFFLYRKVDKLSIIMLMLVVVFGTLTITLHNPNFIKWKTTVIYSVFSIALFFSHFFMPHVLIKKIFHVEMKLPEVMWRRLNIAWAIFFLLCSLANVYAISYFSEERWVDFKFFWLGGLTLLFTFLSGLYLFLCRSRQND
ncbi:septation protein IspZ [Candidatus Erwinia haradaeae]|uniref:Inner membrane-spanning protein YciB n=1 Tax=Candidatus Erwinia haradaeae TaxID=1922217 RepID=A0A451DAG7_9GAMM|nr:septation protein IspZ [Candidatus Erwinia haradaeae]VFP83241.1 Probable intracellular septation protein A [Candidatus Erwinia haradaeae]